MWLRRKKNQTPKEPSPLGQQLNGKVTQFQQKVAGRLNRKTAHWSRQQKITFLVLACLALMGINLLGFLDNTAIAPALHKEAGGVPIPKYWFGPDTGPRFTKQDTVVFTELRQRLDSLLSSDSGRMEIKAFNLIRPGFLDSLLYIERQIFPTLRPIIIPPTLKTLEP